MDVLLDLLSNEVGVRFGQMDCRAIVLNVRPLSTFVPSYADRVAGWLAG